MTETFYVLEGAAESCVAEFWLNGIPVMRRGVQGGESFGVQVNHLLIDGDNTLEMTLFPGPVPSLSRWGAFGPRVHSDAKPPQRAWLQLCKYPFGATVGGPEREILRRLDWSPVAGEFREIAFTIGTKVNLGSLYGRWKWQDAPVLKLDSFAMIELSEFLESLRESIGKGEPEPFIEVSEIRLEEISRAYSTDVAERRAMIDRGVYVDATAPGFEMAPLHPDHFDFRLCVGGRMVECIATDWDPILRGGPNRQGSYCYYDMFLSQIEERWHIVR
jgi:hypothetical protein